MESAISSCPYEPRQSSSLTTGTSTFIRTLARLPPSEVVPHPETVQVVPAVYSSPSDGSMILSMTELLKFWGRGRHHNRKRNYNNHNYNYYNNNDNYNNYNNYHNYHHHNYYNYNNNYYSHNNYNYNHNNYNHNNNY